MAKSKVKLPIWLIITIVVLVLVAFLIVYFFFPELLGNDIPDGSYVGETYTRPLGCHADGEIDIHFLELGNMFTGDCTYIRVGNTDVLIDAGSKTSSISTVSAFLDAHMQDDVLDYVIVTHAHEDHYAGFATSETTDSLFDLYEVGTIIDFALTNQKSGAPMYANYLRERDDEIASGAKHYTARECIEQGKAVFQLSENVSMTILDQKYYYEKSSSENNYSVCTLFTQGEANYLFTGDLEKSGEKSLVEKNDLPNVILYKAGHHGSGTSSSEALLAAIQPQVVAVCCCAGSPEYTKENANQFPTQDFVDRVAPYTKYIYVTTLCLDYSSDNKEEQFTSMNGNIHISVKSGTLEITCSHSKKILMEWDWFIEKRIMPSVWK